MIDIAPLCGTDATAQARVAAELGAAARNVGFLYVTGHGGPSDMFDRLLCATQRFFALPLADKMSVYIGHSRNHRGYVPEGEESFGEGPADAKEAFDLSRDLPSDDPDFLAGNPLLGPNQWPSIEGFAATVSAYYEATFEVGRLLMRGFALSIGEAADRFEAMLIKPPSQLRLIHYPFNATAHDRPGIGAHTDFECFTLLRATAPGLEVMNAAGAWIDVPPKPDAYVVNIGDMLELWTNGEFVATSHRVRRVQEERYSFPLFFAVDYHTHVRPLSLFVNAARPARPGLIAGEHLFAQTVKIFGYQQARLRRGEICMPPDYVELDTFGQLARQTIDE